MARYHINPTTGEVGPCRATVSCPFGDLAEDHFPTAEAARSSYEERMGSPIAPRLQVRRSFWDRLRGVTEEQALAEARSREEAAFLVRFDATIAELRNEKTEPQGNYGYYSVQPRAVFHELLVVARDYDAHREDALELLAHYDGLRAKQKKIEAATQALVKENPYAFRETLGAGRRFLQDRGELLRQVGQDADLFADLKPHCEKLIEAYYGVLKEQQGVRREALELKETIIAEGALTPGDRTQLSERTRQLFAEALSDSSPSIPSPEEVEDRRAWTAARAAALAEFKARDEA